MLSPKIPNRFFSNYPHLFFSMANIIKVPAMGTIIENILALNLTSNLSA
jgi:hypothetical protein